MGVRRLSLGFTLIEIVIVVVVLGILAAIAIPRVVGPNEKIRSSEGKSLLTTLLMAQRSYSLENGGSYATAIGSLDVTVPATSQNFIAPVLANNANEVAALESSRLDFTFKITSDGAINCNGPDCGQVCKGGAGACN